jgi:hypothetical protein
MFGRKPCRNRRKTTRGAWIAIFAILLQALLPLVHHPAGMAMADTLPIGSAKNVCIAPGSAPVLPDKPTKTQHNPPLCEICQAIHAVGGFPPPAAPVLHIISTVEAIVVPSPSAFAALPAAFAPQQPRAPPVFA